MHTPRRIAAALFATGLTAAPSLFAQSTDTPPSQDQAVRLDAFTVSTARDHGYQSTESNTETRFVSELKNTPYSLDIIPAALLSDIGAVNLSDAMNYATGALAFEKVNSPDVTVFQRGFGTLSHLVDGISTQGGFDAIGTERVEVLNGPASVLFGITNPGGTINSTSKQPLPTAFAELAETVGSWGYSRTTVDFGGPLNGSKSIEYRIPAAFTRSDGYFANSNSQSFYTAPVVTWDIDSSTKVTVRLEYRHSYQDPVSYTIGISAGVNPLSWANLSLGLPRDFNGNTPQMYLKAEQILPSMTFYHAFSDMIQIRNVVSQYHWIYNSAYAVRGATQATTNPAYQYPRQSQVDSVGVSDFQDNLDLLGKFNVPGGKLVVDAGVEWKDDFNKTFSSSGLGVGATVQPAWILTNPATWNYNLDYLAGVTPIANNTTSFHSTAYALLLQLETLEHRLFISGGVRHDSTTTDFNNLFNKTNQTFTPGATSEQVGAMYRFDSTWGAYANYSSAFNPIQQTLINASNQSYAAVPVTGKGYEAGIKNELFGGQLVQTLAVYRIDEQNIVENIAGTINGTTSFTYQVQGGLQRSRGIEYNINAALGDNWAILAGYSYNDAHIVKDTAADVGQRIVGAFRDKFDAFAKYSFTVPALRGAFIGVGAVYVSSAPAYVGTLNQLVYPSFFLLNPVVGYSWRIGSYDLSTQINVNNALNRNYLTYGSSAPLPRDFEFTTKIRF